MGGPQMDRKNLNFPLAAAQSFPVTVVKDNYIIFTTIAIIITIINITIHCLQIKDEPAAPYWSRMHS